MVAELRENIARRFLGSTRLTDLLAQDAELLNAAIRMAPKAKYHALLGRCQSENPKWVRKAIQNYTQALELEPTA